MDFIAYRREDLGELFRHRIITLREYILTTSSGVSIVCGFHTIFIAKRIFHVQLSAFETTREKENDFFSATENH